MEVCKEMCKSVGCMRISVRKRQESTKTIRHRVSPNLLDTKITNFLKLSAQKVNLLKSDRWRKEIKVTHELPLLKFIEDGCDELEISARDAKNKVTDICLSSIKRERKK